jgi:PAS domain S-box-containing protein
MPLPSGERYRRIVDRSPDGILVIREARVAFANPAAVHLLGASSADDLLGKSVVELFDPTSTTRISEAILNVAAGLQTSTVDAQITTLAGSSNDVEMTAVLLDIEEQELQLAIRDISERRRAEALLRESEERLTLAFEGAQEGVWDWNFETGAVVYSPRWKRMLGYGEHEIEPHISAWERILHPDDMSRAKHVHDAVLRGAPTYEGEFRLRHREGHYIHVLSRGFPVRSEDGRVVRIVGTHFDLTARRQAEAERAHTELLTRLVFAQEDERRRIAREMHDQFGEQLTALSTRIRMLKEACGEATDVRAHADALERVAQQLDRDVDHLVWELRPTALDDLGLRAALTNYVQDWSKRVGIAADLHTSGLLDERLPSDAETTLYRIAQEALTNVAKHARARHVDVILERRTDYVLLVVEDDGVGFDPNAGGGTEGFGLAGMQERAALVGATLEIESAPDVGTTILVRMTANAPTNHASNHA